MRIDGLFAEVTEILDREAAAGGFKRQRIMEHRRKVAARIGQPG